MPSIQQISSTSVFNLPTNPKATTQKSLPIVAIKSSAITRLSSTIASGISDQEGVSARTISTETFLSEIRKTTPETATTGGNAGTMPNSISESVTTKAGVATSNESFTLGEHINLSTKQMQSEKETQKNCNVKHITPCLSDSYVQNNNGSVTHKLLNVCEDDTVVSGYVGLECSVSPPSSNPFNVFTLNKQGDLYTVETQHSENCEQAIRIVSSSEKVGDCLYNFRTEYDEDTSEDKVINGCKNTIVRGYVNQECLLTEDEDNPWQRFVLESQGDVFTVLTHNYCLKTIYEGNPPIVVDTCLHDFAEPNDNGTITHRVVNPCNSIESLGYIRKGCTVNPPPSGNEWNKFSLKQVLDGISFLIQNKEDCQDPIRSGQPPMSNFEQVYCPAQNASSGNLSGDMPVAERIVAGEGVQSINARHLVYLNSRRSVCTGTLISDKHLLTAAHCVASAYINNIKVYYDSDVKNEKMQLIPKSEYTIKAGHVAPCYVSSSEKNCDLALLELEKPIKNAQSIALPTDQDFCEFAREVSRAMKVDIAFDRGLDKQYDKTQSVWQDGNALIQGFGVEKNAQGGLVSSRRAKQAKVVAFDIAPNDGLIFAAPNNQGNNICFGDSGGPLIYEKKGGEKVQLGVIHGFSCMQKKPTCSNEISLYANLHNRTHRDWLNERMAEDAESVQIGRGDFTRLRISPDSCVKKSDGADGFWSWLGMFTFSIQSGRRVTFTNNCHNKNHPVEVNIRFYSNDKKKKQESIGGIEKVENVSQIGLGETKVFHTNVVSIKTVLTWSDLDK